MGPSPTAPRGWGATPETAGLTGRRSRRLHGRGTEGSPGAGREPLLGPHARVAGGHVAGTRGPSRVSWLPLPPGSPEGKVTRACGRRLPLPNPANGRSSPEVSYPGPRPLSPRRQPSSPQTSRLLGPADGSGEVYPAANIDAVRRRAHSSRPSPAPAALPRDCRRPGRPGAGGRGGL